ncbi:MAG: serine/threonine-protein kinase [Phycisphaerales bacterium]
MLLCSALFSRILAVVQEGGPPRAGPKAMTGPARRQSAPINYAIAAHVLRTIDCEAAEGESESDTPAVDGYLIERELGVGGAGRTFLARRIGSEAKVALKVLHAPVGSRESRSRVWRELDILQQLRLPSLPRLMDFGMSGNSLFVAMEYIEGAPLSQYFEARLPATIEELRARVQILERVARAVQSLHEHGVIHRDIKPSNVIVNDQAAPSIVDLGIATLISTDPMETLTVTGIPVGTPAFMAPEQAQGRRDLTSTRADVYSLGAIGYWLCAGETPHDLSNVTLHEAIRRVGLEAPRDPRSLWADLPRELAAILLKACSPVVLDRYASASDLADDLGSWLLGKPVMAVAQGRWHRSVLWIAKHPAAMAMIVLLVLLPIVGVAITACVVYFSNFRPDKLVLNPDHSGVSLRALNDRELRSWEPDHHSPDAVLLNTFLPTPAGDLDKSRSLIVFRGYQDNESRPLAAIHRYGASEDVEVPFPSPIHVPDALRYAAPITLGSDSMGIRFAMLEDVLPDMDGVARPELVILYHHARRSPACLRVFSLDGTLRYELWHDGHLTHAYWMAQPRLLVLAGVNSDGTWAERGETPKRLTAYPPVVFAVRPAIGVTNAILAWPGFDGDVQPVWYEAVLPASLSDFIRGIELLTSAREFPVGSPYVMMETGVAHSLEDLRTLRAIAWIIDANGRVVDQYPNAHWAAAEGLPDAKSAYLGPLPQRRNARPLTPESQPPHTTNGWPSPLK